MKKKLLFMSLILGSFIANAQFTVTDNSTSNLVTDGQTLEFSEAGCGYIDPCNWKFAVTNTSSENIYMRIFVDDLVNTDGSNFQLCFAGVCLNNVNLNSGYPNTAAMIAPGATNSAGNNFWNQNDPSTTTPMSWTLRFQAFNSLGTPIGTPLSVTYNYVPSLSVDESELTAVEVFPTHVKNKLNVSSNEELTAEFYNILGRRVKQTTVSSGRSTIDVSKLASQLYLVRFTNKAGKSLVKKIIVE